jgi:hypothetical protein
MAVPPRPSFVRLSICGSAAASAVAPESPIQSPASRASLTAAPTLKGPAAKHPTARPHAEAHGASCRHTTDARAPATGTRNATRGRTAEKERREARHLRQRRRQRGNARVSHLVACEPRKPHCRSDPKRPRRPTSDTPKHTARAVAQPPMREPQLQKPATRARGRTAKIATEMKRREARHLRQRRRQRSQARVSDAVACEPRKPHCRSDPE